MKIEDLMKSIKEPASDELKDLTDRRAVRRRSPKMIDGEKIYGAPMPDRPTKKKKITIDGVELEEEPREMDGRLLKLSKGGSVSSASKRADGCAIKGKTRGRMV